jgi:hypothetical protein
LFQPVIRGDLQYVSRIAYIYYSVTRDMFVVLFTAGKAVNNHIFYSPFCIYHFFLFRSSHSLVPETCCYALFTKGTSFLPRLVHHRFANQPDEISGFEGFIDSVESSGLPA